MNKSAIKVAARFAQILTVAGFLLATCWSMDAQTTKPVTSPLDSEKSTADDNSHLNSLDEEMRSKRAIKYAQKEYQDNLDRARNLSFLGTVINASFKEKHYLAQEDFKKLDKAEKLTKHIRNAAGGSEDDVKIEKPPKDLPSALSMFEELTESLKKKVEKTPKHVVSAAVIDEANVLLELIRIVRVLPPKV
jgi:hypothetical protein